MKGGGVVGMDGEKDIVLFGMRDEILPIDMSYMDDREVMLIVDFVHHIAWKELLSRTIQSMHDWSSRARTLFIDHDMSIIQHVVILSKNEVNRLNGCGYKTRKEIYDVYKSYGLTLPNWMPGDYYERKNYIFTD
jgi:hypothetical protein